MPKPNPDLVLFAIEDTQPRSTRLLDLTGQRFGRLVVTERAPNRGVRVHWRCKCDCGGGSEVASYALRSARRPTRSCGCLEQERRVDRTSTDPACWRPSKNHPDGRTGTVAGYQAHYYLDEEPCPPCREANRLETAAKKADDPLRWLRMNLWTKYRLSMERFEELLEEQGGRCAICGSDDPGDVRAGRFHVDHDHSCCPGNKSCGQCIRGLLCRGCNTALGNFADDPARLRSAADYLDKWPGARPVTGLRPRTSRKAARHGAEGTVAS